jgi:hypothetical protein
VAAEAAVQYLAVLVVVLLDKVHTDTVVVEHTETGVVVVLVEVVLEVAVQLLALVQVEQVVLD